MVDTEFLEAAAGFLYLLFVDLAIHVDLVVR
jgi:hypothetical protein